LESEILQGMNKKGNAERNNVPDLILREMRAEIMS
jgi:hypothetical protein